MSTAPTAGGLAEPPPSHQTGRTMTEERRRRPSGARPLENSDRPLGRLSLQLLLTIAVVHLASQQAHTQTAPAATTTAAAAAADQLVRQAFAQQPLSREGLAFDSTKFKSIYEAIRAHPDLREFAALCESRGVKEIVSMDNTALTVFAPIDKALADLLAKARSRSIGLVELAKHHIAPIFVMPNDNMKYPFQFQSYASVSPLYLNQIQAAGSHAAGSYVNNAKILASYLIPTAEAEDTYQTLHLIDRPLEFAYVSRRAQLRAGHNAPAAHQTQQSAGGAGLMAGPSSPSAASSNKVANVKRALSLEDLLGQEADQTAGAIVEFGERFGDLLAGQPQVDLYHARALQSAPNSNAPASFQRAQLLASKRQLDFDKLGSFVAAAQPDGAGAAFRGKLSHLNESSAGSLNTYFLPVNSDELDQLLGAAGPRRLEAELALLAHVIPGQVLFTRTMALGQLHATLLDAAPGPQAQQVSLGLAKALPDNLKLSASALEAEEEEELSRRLLSSPLLLQAECAPLDPARQQAAQPQQQPPVLRNGLTQSEILLSDIPIANGVLHLIKRPVLVQSNNLLNYINDNERQLTNFVQALGSQSGALQVAGAGPLRLQPVELNRFRELLARDLGLLSSFFSPELLHSNRTILAPSDEAFGRLRYDLRALIFQDELMVPAHWDVSYRRDLLERLVKRHLIPERTITSDSVGLSPTGQQAVAALNGQLLGFRLARSGDLQVDCDASSGRLVQRDLIGTNGVLHVIDRVLGEELETVHSLLSSLVLRYSSQLAAGGQPSPREQLGQLVESGLRQLSGGDPLPPPSPPPQAEGGPTQESTRTSGAPNPARQSPELELISKTLGQFLDELDSGRRQLLSRSVNISFQLAKLAARAEGHDDWNEKFANQQQQFTYFVPNDLAWLRLQQQQPELYKPLAYFLDQQQQPPPEDGRHEQAALVVAGRAPLMAAQSAPAPRSSESSHRLLQILERHLIGNSKLAPRELNQLASLQTAGASLRLVESAPQAADGTPATTAGQSGNNGAFAALHAILGDGRSSANELQVSSQQTATRKALKLGATQANILQAHETSNGFVYLIDGVLILPDDSEYIVQTSATPAISSSMSSLLGAHNSAILDYIQSLFTSRTSGQMSANSMIALIGTLTLACVALALVALALIVRRHRQNKSLNRHQQLESGLTSSSSANSGSTSTTKSL